MVNANICNQPIKTQERERSSSLLFELYGRKKGKDSQPTSLFSNKMETDFEDYTISQKNSRKHGANRMEGWKHWPEASDQSQQCDGACVRPIHPILDSEFKPKRLSRSSATTESVALCFLALPSFSVS